jgi:c-di-GMP-binding flagellar brake protein YcgR
MTVERRKYQRMSIKSVAEITLSAKGQPLFAFVGGISRGGLEMFSQQSFPAGQAMRVRLTFLSRQGRQIQEALEGTIRWSSRLGEAHIAGLEFTAPIEERDHPALWAYLTHTGAGRQPA